MFEPIRVWILNSEIALHHPLLEIISWICQIIITVLAVVGSGFAYVQLREANRTRAAELIMDLDRRWDSSEIRSARSVIIKTREEITSQISQDNPLASDAVKMERAKAMWKERLAAMRKDQPDDYHLLIGFLGFFETLGMMVKRDYISKNDALGLFAGSIMQLERCFREHIEDRQKEMGVPKGFFEHALHLCDLAKAEISQ